jgi:hypothetical protein
MQQNQSLIDHGTLASLLAMLRDRQRRGEYTAPEQSDLIAKWEAQQCPAS